MIDLKDIKTKISKKENFFSFLIILIIFLADRYSKIHAVDNLNDSILYINDFINFNLVWNTGIGFGLLSSNSDIIYNSISLVILFVSIFLMYLIYISKIFEKILFSFILGGALGNLYDRITFFAVPDFIDIHFKNFHWFTFNIADIFISIGVIMLICKDIFFKNEKNF